MNKRSITTILVIAVIICIGGFACLRLHSNYSNASAETETHDDLEVHNEKCEYLVDISQEELNEKLEKKDSFWVYIGRPSCPTTCKVSEKKEMKAYVEDLHVHEIPAILKVEEGKITVLDMQTENDVKQFEKEF